jgi:hypothetical protein
MHRAKNIRHDVRLSVLKEMQVKSMNGYILRSRACTRRVKRRSRWRRRRRRRGVPIVICFRHRRIDWVLPSVKDARSVNGKSIREILLLSRLSLQAPSWKREN